jgi:ABC-2 type transport system permease protein
MTLTAFRWEVRKLLAQKRTYIGLGAGIVFALAFVITLSIQHGGVPREVPFGRHVRDSGLAIPFILLTFSSIFGAPLVAALVAGDIVAAEDTHRTLKTMLTRSAGRGSIYFGKVLAASAYVAGVLLITATTAVAAGTIAWGFKPVTDLSGQGMSAAHTLGLIAAAYGVYFLPVLVIAAVALFLSTVTRNGAASLVGALLFALGMQLLAALHALRGAKPYLLPQQLEAWRGLAHSRPDWTTVGRAFWVCALYIALPVLAGWLAFSRREISNAEEKGLTKYSLATGPRCIPPNSPSRLASRRARTERGPAAGSRAIRRASRRRRARTSTARPPRLARADASRLPRRR